ncbi:MAG: hypothetical protein U0840_21040 [Gemmataceae bacterium]
MPVVCPRCTSLAEPGQECLRCGASVPNVALESTTPSFGPRWQQTAWGRILIGLIVSQGLFYGLRHLVTAILLAIQGGNATDLWNDVQNLLVLQAIQFIGLIAGGMLAGGAQQNGMILGAIVGVWNGVFSVLLRQNPAQELTIVGLYGQPILHAAFGAIGGMLGSIIWAPIPSAPVPVLLSAAPKRVQRKGPGLLAGKVAWFRVLTGSAFSVAGTLSATMIFEKVLEVSGGRLGTSHELQDRIITWEIKALAILMGGALAGSTTPNGFKQGVCVGIASSVMLIGVQAPLTQNWFMLSVYITISTISLAMVGGWFGGQLFPPIVKYHRNRNLGLPSW